MLTETFNTLEKCH